MESIISNICLWFRKEKEQTKVPPADEVFALHKDEDVPSFGNKVKT